eukprot:1827770-Rhodomonas_salina.1
MFWRNWVGVMCAADGSVEPRREPLFFVPFLGGCTVRADKSGSRQERGCAVLQAVLEHQFYLRSFDTEST